MKYKIEIAPLADYFVVAAKDIMTGELKEAFTLNESAADMLRLFCEGKTPEEVSINIASMYDAPLDIVIKDVSAFVEELQLKGIY